MLTQPQRGVKPTSLLANGFSLSTICSFISIATKVPIMALRVRSSKGDYSNSLVMVDSSSTDVSVGLLSISGTSLAGIRDSVTIHFDELSSEPSSIGDSGPVGSGTIVSKVSLRHHGIPDVNPAIFVTPGSLVTSLD